MGLKFSSSFFKNFFPLSYAFQNCSCRNKEKVAFRSRKWVMRRLRFTYWPLQGLVFVALPIDVILPNGPILWKYSLSQIFFSKVLFPIISNAVECQFKGGKEKEKMNKVAHIPCHAKMCNSFFNLSLKDANSLLWTECLWCPPNSYVESLTLLWWYQKVRPFVIGSWESSPHE